LLRKRNSFRLLRLEEKGRLSEEGKDNLEPADKGKKGKTGPARKIATGGERENGEIGKKKRRALRPFVACRERKKKKKGRGALHSPR